MRSISVVGFVLGLLTLVLGSDAQAGTYDNAIWRSNYEVLSADINSDGRLDVLMRARPRKIFIGAGPNPFIANARPPSPTFVLYSSGSSYTLDANPSSTVINSSSWQANTHTLSYGKFGSTGTGGVIVKANATGQVTFAIIASASTGIPLIMQTLVPANFFGKDLGTAGLSTCKHGYFSLANFCDINADGFDDMILAINGVLFDLATLYSASQGGFQTTAPSDDTKIRGTIAAFTAATQAGASTFNGNAPGFYGSSTNTVNWTTVYDLLTRLLEALQRLSWAWVQGTITGNTAIYTMPITDPSGAPQTLTFTLIKESGVWKIQNLQ